MAFYEGKYPVACVSQNIASSLAGVAPLAAYLTATEAEVALSV